MGHCVPPVPTSGPLSHQIYIFLNFPIIRAGQGFEHPNVASLLGCWSEELYVFPLLFYTEPRELTKSRYYFFKTFIQWLHTNIISLQLHRICRALSYVIFSEYIAVYFLHLIQKYLERSHGVLRENVLASFIKDLIQITTSARVVRCTFKIL